MPRINPFAETVLQVSQFIELCNSLFAELPVMVEGEVANYSISRGKFVFFDLKDEAQEARVSCFMMAHQLSSPLEDGMRVVAHGRPGLYQKSGQFRLSCQRVEAKGEGSVKRAFELLKAKLEQEGLFATERKRRLPRFAQRVGIISSSEAAGFGDFKKIAFSRLPGVRFYMANAAVQGVDAEREITQAFDALNGLPLDAIVLIRGGGSMEDLHAFNSEAVARAICRSKAPVLVGVGHERDITIADYCADVRAATPSNAAQILLPAKEEVLQEALSLTHNGRLRVETALRARRDAVKFRIASQRQSLLNALSQYRLKAVGAIKSVEALSPEATLRRGFSITRDAAGKPLTHVSQAKPGQAITTIVQDGRIQSLVS